MLIFRSSRSQTFFKIGVLKNFATLTGKHPCWPLQAFFYRIPKVAAVGFRGSKYFFFSWVWHLLLTVAPAFAPNPFENMSWNLRSSHWNSFKNGVLRNFANFTVKQLCWSLFFIALQAFRPAALLKKAPRQMFSCGIHKIFKNT